MDTSNCRNTEKLSEKDTDRNSTKSLKQSSKVFIIRKSILDDLYEKGELPLYNFIVPTALGVSAILMLLYFIIRNEFIRDFEFILAYAFVEIRNLPVSIALNYVVADLGILVTFVGLLIWRHTRALTENKRFVDYCALVLCAVFHYIYFALPFRFIDISKQPFSSRAVFSTLQVYWFMKFHSYIRENIPSILSSREEDHEESKNLLSSFGKFLYFMLAPTVIYRESYPRAKYFDLRKCSQHLINIACTVVIPMVPIVFFLPSSVQRCETHLSLLETVREVIFWFTILNVIMFIIQPFGLFHSFYNLWAEMTLFGDRMFYLDWWNATSLYDLSKRWSFPVHEWLEFYVYADSCNVLQVKKKTAAFLAFLVSAIGHDYILAVTFGFLMPTFTINALLFVIFLRLYEPSTVKSNKPKGSKKANVWIKFLLSYFIVIFLHYLVICDRAKCSVAQEASWISIIYARQC